jgi:hypothetical protein
MPKGEGEKGKVPEAARRPEKLFLPTAQHRWGRFWYRVENTLRRRALRACRGLVKKSYEPKRESHA